MHTTNGGPAPNTTTRRATIDEAVSAVTDLANGEAGQTNCNHDGPANAAAAVTGFGF